MVVPGDLLVGVLFPDPELVILGVLYGYILGGNVTQRRCPVAQYKTLGEVFRASERR